MSHRYGERLPPRPRGPRKPSSLGASDAHSADRTDNAPAIPTESDTTRERTTAVLTEAGSSHTEVLKSALPLPSPDDMSTWSLAQARTHLEEVVIQKRKATGQAREDLETQRLSLIERVTRLERAEQKKRDAAKRSEILHFRLAYGETVKGTNLYNYAVVIGRDVAPPPPDPIEKSWRKTRFGPNTRRSGPDDAPRKVKKNDEEEEENPEEELYSKRWKLKVGCRWKVFKWCSKADIGAEKTWARGG